MKRSTTRQLARRSRRHWITSPPSAVAVVALVPAALSPEQLEAALHEVGVAAAAVLELSDWKTSANNVYGRSCAGAGGELSR